MLVSVIIPNFNHDKFLQLRLDSILSQTYQDIELIILDDASTDSSVDIISKTIFNCDKISHFIVNESNSGSTFKQWEKGIKLAKGDLIWIAESDDYADINFLKLAVEKFQRFNIGIFYCNSWKINALNEQMGIELSQPDFENDFILEGMDFIAEFMILDNVIYNASSVVFKNPNFATTTLELKSDFKLCADHLFWIQMLRDCKIYYSSEVKNYFRRLDYGVTNSIGKVKSLNERIVISKYLHTLFTRSKFLRRRNINLIYLIISSNISIKEKYAALKEIKSMFRSILNFSYLIFRSYIIFIYNQLFTK